MGYTKIIDNIHIGNWYDAYQYGEDFDYIINVATNEEFTNAEHELLRSPKRPILISAPFLDDNIADISRLYDIGNMLDFFSDETKDHLNYNQILVHCAAGIERSPLAVAWWMVTIRDHPACTWDDAYKFILSKRPQVEDRRYWIPMAYREGK